MAGTSTSTVGLRTSLSPVWLTSIAAVQRAFDQNRLLSFCRAFNTCLPGAKCGAYSGLGGAVKATVCGVCKVGTFLVTRQVLG